WLFRRSAKGASVHAGDHDIAQQQVDPFRLTNERKRAVAIGRFQDPVIETAQRLGDKGPDLGIVLHHQHRFQAALWAWGRLRFICRRASAGKAARQVDLDRGSFADLAVNPDMAAALSYEAVDLAEAETGPRAGRFCREERIERLADEFLRHADAGIRYRDHDVLAGLYPIGGRAIGFIQERIAGFDRQLAARRHRVARVDGKIEKCRFKLGPVDLDLPQAAAPYRFNRDIFAQRSADQVGHVRDQAAGVDRTRVERLVARKCQEALGQFGGAFGRPPDPR